MVDNKFILNPHFCQDTNCHEIAALPRLAEMSFAQRSCGECRKVSVKFHAKLFSAADIHKAAEEAPPP